MKNKTIQISIWPIALIAVLIGAVIAIGFAGRSDANAASANEGAIQVAQDGNTPLVQQFEDVPDSNPFAQYINALYVDSIVGGYVCGGTGEPCIPPENRPYYRPNNNVTRGQMGKFADLGRRNISDAVGLRLVMTNTLQPSLVISSTTTDSININNASGSEAIQSICTRANTNCWAFYGNAQTGDRPAYFEGGRGAYISSSDSTYAGLAARASGANAYGGDIRSTNYRGAYIKSDDTSYYSLYVDAPVSTPTAGNFAGFNTSVVILGNLSVSGSKGGYVVDLMQNTGAAALEPGDVVSIVGSSAAVLGEIPVVTVQKAVTAYDTGVAGVVDQIMYVPSAEVRTAYKAQEQARREAMDRRSRAEALAAASGVKFDPASIEVPEATITDSEANVYPDAGAANAETGRYINVVTLGSYKAVKVDASFGAIKAGDLLTTSPHAGYAMKVTDRANAMGAVIGKALGNLDTGTGLIPVLVTLK